jgi:hypothetical protein
MMHPHFLVVGAARAGTTSLHYYLRQHPSLFVPARKEPCFFSFPEEAPKYKHGKFAFAVHSPEKYFKLFEDAQEGQVSGEISTPYLYLYEQTIRNIMQYHRAYHKLKILILLRNPVERAFSQYMWRLRDGRETLSFEEAISKEADRKKKGYSFDYFYVERGMYFRQVKAYLDSFKAVKIILLDDMVRDAEGMLRVICRYLGVDEHHVFRVLETQNTSYEPRWNLLGRLITSENRLKFHVLDQLPDSWKQGIRQQFDRWNSKSNEPVLLSAETESYLRSVYREDILRLQDLIGRDLSAWLKPKESS